MVTEKVARVCRTTSQARSQPIPGQSRSPYATHVRYTVTK